LDIPVYGLQNPVNDFIGLKGYLGGRAFTREHAGRRKMEDTVLSHSSHIRLRLDFSKPSGLTR